MLEDLLEKFKELSKPNIMEYNKKLIPNCKKVYGVSIPLLRKLAKEIISNDYKLFLQECDGSSLELQFLEGFVIAGAKMDLTERIEYLSAFISKMDNWAVCDSFVASLKFTKKYPEEMLKVVDRFKASKKEFEVRFCAVFLMAYYLTTNYVDKAVQIIQDLYLEEYYSKMGVAWFIATLMVDYPEYAIRIIQNPKMDTWTIGKAITKMRESYRVPNAILEDYLKPKESTNI